MVSGECESTQSFHLFSICDSVGNSWVCCEDFGIERNQSSEKRRIAHNSVFAAHRLKNAVPRLRDGIFLFLRAIQTLRMIIEMRTYKIKAGRRDEFLLRKEVIQPQVPLRLPCYDFIPVTAHSVDGCFPCGLARRLRLQVTSMM